MLEMPKALESEKALLGGLQLSPYNLSEIRKIVESSDFYRREHEELWNLLIRMSDSGVPIDTVTVPEEIINQGLVERVGGLSYIIGLSEYCPATINLDYYASEIADKSRRRKLLQLNTDMEDMVSRHEDVGDIVESLVGKLQDLKAGSVRCKWESASVFSNEEMFSIQERGQSGLEVTGIPTGWDSLDRLTLGWQPGELVVIGARPSIGKTAIGLNIAINSASAGVVGFFSLEQSGKQIARRLLSIRSRVGSRDIRIGNLAADEWDRIFEANEWLKEQKIMIDDTSGLDIDALRARATDLAQQGNLKIIIVDYLQYIKTKRNNVNRNEQIAEISRGLKALAKELSVPVIALAQLSRDTEKRADKRPILSDLRESGAIEQDADSVIFLHRESREATSAELIIAKCRDGETGAVTLEYIGKNYLFKEPGVGDLNL